MEPKALTVVFAETSPISILKIFVPSSHRVQKVAVYFVFLMQRSSWVEQEAEEDGGERGNCCSAAFLSEKRDPQT